MTFWYPLQPLFERMSALVPDAPPVYLVGGAVRDLLRGEALHDLDFGVDGDALAYARVLANRLGGAYYVMDRERETARVIVDGAAGRQVLDFARLRGPDLHADLLLRDFTLNAMALDIRHPDMIIDPLHGALDLRARRLRACSPESFRSDPNRILRALRQAVSLKLRIEHETLHQLRQAVGLLPQVSAERQRDEIVRILGGRRPASVMRSLEMLGVLPLVFPELPALKGVTQSAPHVLDVWDHTLEVVARLEQLLLVLNPVYNADEAGSLLLGLAVVRIGRYREQIGAHLDAPFTPDRSARAMLFLAALYHDVAKPRTRMVEPDGRVHFFDHDEVGAQMAGQRAAELRLSNAEAERVRLVVRHHMRPLLLGMSGELPTRRAIYRFFRQAGEAGVDVCLLSMADFLGTYGPTIKQEAWRHHLDVVRSLMESWWEKPQEAVAPPALLTGHDLINVFGLQPGRQVGELLEALREAQAVGEVSSRAEALAFVKQKTGG